MARELLGVPDGAVSTFDVEPDRITSDALAGRIEAALPGVPAADQPVQPDGRRRHGRLDLFLLLAVGLAVLVGGVGIANTMLMSTSERYVEFGVMRTNGWTRRNMLSW